MICSAFINTQSGLSLTRHIQELGSHACVLSVGK